MITTIYLYDRFRSHGCVAISHSDLPVVQATIEEHAWVSDETVAQVNDTMGVSQDRVLQELQYSSLFRSD